MFGRRNFFLKIFVQKEKFDSIVQAAQWNEREREWECKQQSIFNTKYHKCHQVWELFYDTEDHLHGGCCCLCLPRRIPYKLFRLFVVRTNECKWETKRKMKLNHVFGWWRAFFFLFYTLFCKILAYTYILCATILYWILYAVWILTN